MRDLPQHLTTRADDNHAPPVTLPPKGTSYLRIVRGCQDLVRFFALLRIQPHAPPLVRAPVNSFQFQPAPYSPGGVLNALAAALRGASPLTLSTHRLRRGLPGYLILFAPHAFAPQRQLQTESRLRHWCSSTSLRISPLHVEFHSPLLHSSSPVSIDLPVEPGLSHQT